MTIVPTVRVRHMQTALAFYTQVLDFVLASADAEVSNPDAPVEVHEGPLNQTWGTREFYVDDPDGNTLRFMQG